jgi:hypothetical protein
MATRPSFPIPKLRAISSTCVKASFNARPCRRRNALSAQLSGFAPPARYRNAKSSTTRCSSRRALVIPTAYAYSHTLTIIAGWYSSPPSALYACSKLLRSRWATIRRMKKHR